MSKKIRVLQVIKTLNISGAERFAINLASQLDPEQYEVQLCAFFHDGSPIETHWYREMTTQGINTWFATEWHGLNHFASYLKGLKELSHHLQTWQTDIIQSHFQLGTLAALYCRNIGLAKKVVRTAQNHTRKEWAPGLYGWIRYKLFSGWIYPMACDVEVGVSHAIVKELKISPGSKFARHKPQLITNAIPNDLIEQAQVYPRRQRVTREYVVGSIGRFMPQKGYYYLINAIPQVEKALPGVKFWLIGDGELGDNLEELARELGVAEDIRFCGRQTNVLPWLREMDMFVLPSLWEGFPLVIMESMAAGIPVLATNIDGVNDIVHSGKNGWLVPPADSSALANGIVAILSNLNDTKRITENAIKDLEAYKFNRVAAQYSQLYSDLLN